MLIKGVFQVGQFPSIWAFRSHRQEPALFYKSHRFFIQFSACSGHDRFVKFNRRGGANKQRGGGKIILKLIDGGARLLETPEYVQGSLINTSLNLKALKLEMWIGTKITLRELAG